jgi:hypothetical protein
MTKIKKVVGETVKKMNDKLNQVNKQIDVIYIGE